MTPFEKELIEDGIADSRVEAVYCAFDQLHAAIARMDSLNRHRFFNRKLEEWLMIFQRVEGVSDVMKAPQLDRSERLWMFKDRVKRK